MHGHALAWGILAAAAASYLVLTTGTTPPRLEDRAARAARRGRIARFVASWLVTAAALTWPVDDLARHWSLTALVVQEICLTLVAPPLLLTSLPREAVIRLTSPHAVDAALGWLTRPLVATVVFNATVLFSLLGVSVAAQSGSAALHGLMAMALFAAGTIMWIPALGILPGANRLTPAGRSAFLFIQSMLANFPSLVFDVAKRPLYPAFDHPGTLLRAMADQHLAGAVAKVGAIAILWGSAAGIWWAGRQAKHKGIDPNPLRWEDVERELLRLDRRPRRRSASGG